MQFKTINLFGAGNIGLNICNLLIYEGIAETINLVTDQDEKFIKTLKLDFLNSSPYTKNKTNLDSYTYENFPHSSINIICGGTKQKAGDKRIDVIKQNKRYLKKILKKKLQGEWIVVTNPDDLLAEYLYSNSDLKTNQITALGISLDNMRGNAKAIYNNILGQHNEDIYTKEGDLLNEIVRIPYEIIENKGYTTYGIAYVMLWYLKYKLRYEYRIVSKYNNEKGIFESKEI